MGDFAGAKSQSRVPPGPDNQQDTWWPAEGTCASHVSVLPV